MKAIILAAGEGTRMQPWTTILSKGLLPVRGVPVTRIIAERLLDAGITDIYLSITKNFLRHYMHEFRDLPEVRLSVSERALGTVGNTVSVLRDYLITDEFLLYYGDELTNININELLIFHALKEDSAATLALVSGMPLDIGIVELENERITKVKEKPPFPLLTWTGIAVISKKLNELLLNKNFYDFSYDVFPWLIENNYKLYGKVFRDAIWLDIGTLSHYRRANEQ